MLLRDAESGMTEKLSVLLEASGVAVLWISPAIPLGFIRSMV